MRNKRARELRKAVIAKMGTKNRLTFIKKMLPGNKYHQMAINDGYIAVYRRLKKNYAENKGCLKNFNS